MPCAMSDYVPESDERKQEETQEKMGNPLKKKVLGL